MIHPSVQLARQVVAMYPRHSFIHVQADGDVTHVAVYDVDGFVHHFDVTYHGPEFGWLLDEDPRTVNQVEPKPGGEV